MTDPATVYVETRDVPLGDLTRYPGNARKGNLDAIRRSLRKHGQYKSLTVRAVDGGGLVILAGNNTFDALTAEKHLVARCEIVTCSDEDAKEINLLDNTTSDAAEWDRLLLAEQLVDMPEEHLGDLGFEAEFTDDLFRSTGALADAATGFLDDFTVPPPAPGPPDGHAAGDGEGSGAPAGDPAVQYVQVHWLVTLPQRATIYAALSAARDRLQLATAADALEAITRDYLESARPADG